MNSKSGQGRGTSADLAPHPTRGKLLPPEVLTEVEILELIGAYDPWWNPAVEAQATDRAYRIGQRQPVTVVKMVCEGSAEERVLELQARKASLTRALQEGAERSSQGGLALDAKDVELMLAPMQ